MAQTKISRRQWAGAAALLAASSPSQLPAQERAPESTADLLMQAKQSLARNHETLVKFKLDRAVEPATRYEA
jgi:hypothetical protein